MPQECWVNERNFLLQPENSIHREQALNEVKLHKEVQMQKSTAQRSLVQNLSVLSLTVAPPSHL